MGRTRTNLLASAWIVALVLLPGAASAKGGGSWDIIDRDGFLMAGQKTTARALIPRQRPFPRSAWLVEGWNFSVRRAMPRERIPLGRLSPKRYELYGDPMIAFELRFTAPESPGEYTIVTCTRPCDEIASQPYPRAITVVESRVEARLRKELLERDGRISELGLAMGRARSRARALEDRLSDHLGYLGNHVTRITRLERLVADDRGDQDEEPSSAVALAGVAGGVGALLGVRALLRRREGCR
jgi:hypothetical protein